MTDITISPNFDAASGKYNSNSNPQTYTPLVNVDLRPLANGALAPVFGYGSTVSTDFGQEGKSIKVLTYPSNPGTLCGTHGFAGRVTLPVPIPLGNTIWQRMKFRFPSAFSFGYTYGSGAPSSPVGDGCGGASADGNPTGIKWLVLSPNNGTGRIYYNASNSLRSITQTATSGVLAIEANPAAQQNARIVFPRDQSVTIEMACLVAHSGGYVRVWVDGVLLAEAVNVRTIDNLSTSIIESYTLYISPAMTPAKVNSPPTYAASITVFCALQSDTSLIKSRVKNSALHIIAAKNKGATFQRIRVRRRLSSFSRTEFTPLMPFHFQILIF